MPVFCRPRIAAGLLTFAFLLSTVSQASAQNLASTTISSGASSCDLTNCLTVPAVNRPGFGIDITGSGTWTVVFEGLKGAPGTATWRQVPYTNDASPSTIATSSVTAAGSFTVPNLGYTAVRVRASAYTSGTPVVTFTVSQASAAGGGGGGSGFDGVLLDAAGGDPVTDTANDAIRVNVVAGAGSGGTAMTDDAAFTPATTSITPTGAMFDDVTPDSVNEGDAGAIRMSANRNMYTTLRDAAGNERGANVNASNQLETSAAQSGTWTVQPGNTANTTPWLVAGNVTPADNTSPTNAAPVTNYNMCFDGTNWDRCTVSTGGSGVIDSNTTRVTIATDDPVNDAAVKTDANMVAHDAVDAGNPLKVGGYASSTIPTAVAAADRVNAWYTLNGAAVVANVDPCSRGTKVHVPISQATSTELFTGTASNRTFVCSVSIVQMASSTQTWSLVSGTGTTCGTSTSALVGATTAANGTNQSLTQGNGAAWFLKTDTDADNVCLLQSGTDRINGWLTYVVAPNQ